MTNREGQEENGMRLWGIYNQETGVNKSLIGRIDRITIEVMGMTKRTKLILLIRVWIVLKRFRKRT